jgi:Gpi18-like mannosyltransferase
MDSLAALPMLIAVVLLIDKKPEWAIVFFVLAVLTKPQGALILLILLPVFIGQLIQKELVWWRAITAPLAGLVTFILVAVPWSLESYIPNSISKVPVLGDILGLAWQYFSTAGLFPVLTANAYNIWATVGKIPMAHQFQDGRVYWLTDNYLVFGIPAGIIGTALFAIVAILIFWLLIKKHNATQVLTAFSLLLVAFFALPTRVHERYLVQAFAVLAIVWAVKLWQRAALVVLALANTVNLHAILAANLFVETVPIVSSPSASSGGIVPFDNSMRVLTAVESPEYYGISWVRMDANWAREEWLVWLVIFIHTAALVVLLVQYLRINDFNLRLRKRKELV